LHAAFTQTVDAFTDGLTAMKLTGADSRSYPAWLGGIMLK